MEQPPLDHHYVVMHLDGAKRVRRKRDGRPIDGVVEQHSLTLVPAGNAYVWQTQGPIAFAHLYIDPRQLQAICTRDYEVDGVATFLEDKVGCRDIFLEPLFSAMLREIQFGRPASRLRLDSLFESFCFQLVHKHTSRPAMTTPRVVALASHRLRRVLDFIEAQMGRDLTLADLAAAAGTGQAHFSHAFRLAMGCSPYRYLVRRRIEYSKVLLLTGKQSLSSISSACGFMRTAQFALMFKSVTGVGPKRYRNDHRSN